LRSAFRRRQHGVHDGVFAPQSDEALRIGLVNRLYPPDQLRAQTYAYARHLADFVSPTAKWWWRCAAAISAKASRALWRSGRRGLRESRGMSLQPVVALRAMPGTLRSSGFARLRHA